jgi:hypothetical protein
VDLAFLVVDLQEVVGEGLVELVEMRVVLQVHHMARVQVQRLVVQVE